ncbi:hypothetical protein R3X28_05895 [Maribacter sp. TH_r10]|uniref:hypothetical protein n=1 Tax=Maribacter sp. TH_r10 TaxID=3082086 RepID=UPI00295325F3|nr:hypothetical protein [Maribacter sp. TH_r10]MDV7138396.1 hypothetical protein [Maribacter sp. TH_r10]
MKKVVVLALLLWAVHPCANAQGKSSKGENVVVVVNKSNKKLTHIVPFEEGNIRNLNKLYPKSTFYAGKLYRSSKFKRAITKKSQLKGTENLNLPQGSLVSINTDKPFIPGNQFVPGDQFLIMFDKKKKMVVLKVR